MFISLFFLYGNKTGVLTFPPTETSQNIELQLSNLPFMQKFDVIKIKLFDISGDDHPEIETEKESMTVTIENNISPISVGFQNKIIKCYQKDCTEGLDLVICRSNLMKENDCSVEVLVVREPENQIQQLGQMGKINNPLIAQNPVDPKQSIENATVEETFTVNFQGHETTKNLNISIPQEPQNKTSSEIKCYLKNPQAPIYTVIDADKAELKIEVQNDVKKAIFGFFNKKSSVERISNNMAEVLIERYNRASEMEVLEVLVNHKIQEKITFAPGQTEGKLVMKIEHIPFEIKESPVSLKLISAEGPYGPTIDPERSDHILNIVNNISFPTMTFHQAKSQMLQTETDHKIMLKHTGWINHPISINWNGKIISTSDFDLSKPSQHGIKYYEDLQGKIIFGQEKEHEKNKGSMYAEQDAWIIIQPYPLPLPNDLTEIEFEITADQPALSFKNHKIPVKIGEYPKHKLTIQNNIPRPVINFNCNKLKTSQSGKQAKITVNRNFKFNQEDISACVLNSEVAVTYEIKNLNTQTVTTGQLVIRANSAEGIILLDLEQHPLQDDKTTYQIEIKEITQGDFFPVIGSDNTCTVTVENDLPCPKFGFEKDVVHASQSTGKAFIPVQKMNAAEIFKKKEFPICVIEE